MSETDLADTDTGWLPVGAVVHCQRKANGRWWSMTGVIDGTTTDERYLLRDRETGERWLPKINADVLRVVEVISPGGAGAQPDPMSFGDAVNWKRAGSSTGPTHWVEAEPAQPPQSEPRNREQQMVGVLQAENELRRKVALGERGRWTREEWVAEAEEIMNDPFGSVSMLLNGHIMAIFEELHELRGKVKGRDQSQERR